MSRSARREADDAMNLDIRVQPRARRDELGGVRDGRVLVRVTAPPVEGRANVAVCAAIARTVGVPRGRVSVVRGASSRDKVVRIEGVEDEAAVRAALGLP
jgi:uncharacterized protein (TIGR00251 family)